MANSKERIKNKLQKVKRKIQKIQDSLEAPKRKLTYLERLEAISGKLPYGYAKRAVELNPELTELQVYQVANALHLDFDVLQLLEEIAHENAKELSRWMECAENV